MTPDTVAEIVGATRMPKGYRLVVEPQRRFETRNLWRVQVWHDGERVRGLAYYPSALMDGIVAAKRWAWEQSRAERVSA